MICVGAYLWTYHMIRPLGTKLADNLDLVCRRSSYHPSLRHKLCTTKTSSEAPDPREKAVVAKAKHPKDHLSAEQPLSRTPSLWQHLSPTACKYLRPKAYPRPLGFIACVAHNRLASPSRCYMCFNTFACGAHGRQQGLFPTCDLLHEKDIYIYIYIYIYMESIFSSQLQNKLFCSHLHLR